MEAATVKIDVGDEETKTALLVSRLLELLEVPPTFGAAAGLPLLTWGGIVAWTRYSSPKGKTAKRGEVEIDKNETIYLVLARTHRRRRRSERVWTSFVALSVGQVLARQPWRTAPVPDY